MTSERPASPRSTGPVWCLAGLVVFSVGLLARGAAALPFWYDESLTVRLSRLGIPGELWSGLTAGFDLNPPLLYVATKLARLLPGPETLTARLPGLAGYVALVVSMFSFLRRRVGAWLALAATALLPLADYTVRYAVEARAYMLLLGMAGCALVCWQATVDRSSRSAAIGLTLTTASALLLHVWGILLPLAMVFGETVEILRARRVRWRVVWSLAAATPALALYPALLRSSTTLVFDGVVYGPTAGKLTAAFKSSVPRPRVLAAALLAAGLVGWWVGRRRASGSRTAGSFTASERAVLAALLLSPIVPCLYAWVATGAFMPRYAMFAVPAVASLMAAAMHWLGRGERLAGQAAAGVALMGVLLYLPSRIPTAGMQRAVIESLSSLEGQLDPSVPVVLVNPIDVTSFDEQADEALRRRAAFVADPDLALRYTGTNAIDLGYLRGEPYLRIRVPRLSYVELTGGRSRLYLVGKWQTLSWLPQRLKDDGWTIQEIGGTRQAPVFDARHGNSSEDARLKGARLDPEFTGVGSVGAGPQLRACEKIASCTKDGPFSRGRSSDVIADVRTED
jgi:hypothetical protein